MQNQNESNNKPLLYTIIAILVVIIAVLLYMLNNVSVEKDNTEKAKTAVEETLKGKEEALVKAELLLEQYQKDSLALAGDNLILSEELVSRKKEIAKLVADLKSNKANSQAAVNYLNKQLADLLARLAQVESENEELITKNEVLTNQNDNLNKENTNLSADKAKLKSLASRLQASAVKIETLKKKWLTGKETGTLKANAVEAFRISFSINENNVAEAGDKTLYVKITGPEGVTLANSGQGGTFDIDGKSSKYTYKISAVFENETKPVQPTVWKPTEQLKPGKYTVEIYSEGYKMGSTLLDLK
ncbi:hypothetical protein LBMAG26_10750 [Bacteroidota bacterium]|nr:hypothetical protein LBMAG26_10750 [Bacteroidota bacterium]